MVLTFQIASRKTSDFFLLSFLFLPGAKFYIKLFDFVYAPHTQWSQLDVVG